MIINFVPSVVKLREPLRQRHQQGQAGGAAVVREIFEMYARGETAAEITKHLNAKQVETSQGKELNKNSLHRLLRNKRYIGYYIPLVEAPSYSAL